MSWCPPSAIRSSAHPPAWCPAACTPAATAGSAWPIWADGNAPVARMTSKGWAARADPEVMGHRPLQPCLVPECGYGQHRYRLCYKHSHGWEKAGRPVVDQWKPELAGTPAVVCAIPGCALWAELDAGWCRSHHTRWRQRGRPPTAEFITHCASYGEDRFDFRPLPPQLRLEIGYALQCRVDANRTRTTPRSIKLDHCPQAASSRCWSVRLADWLAGLRPRRGNTPRAFLGYAIECLHDLHDGAGWDSEYERDVWLLRRLGMPTTTGPAWISPRCNHCGCGSWSNDGAGGGCPAGSGWDNCAKTASRSCGCRS